jgi:hypothetical protein
MKRPIRKPETSADEAARREEKKPCRRPYEPPRVNVHNAKTAILGPLASPTLDGASGSFRP